MSVSPSRFGGFIEHGAEALLANVRPEAGDDDSLKIGDGWAFAQEETEEDEG